MEHLQRSWRTLWIPNVNPDFKPTSIWNSIGMHKIQKRPIAVGDDIKKANDVFSNLVMTIELLMVEKLFHFWLKLKKSLKILEDWI